MLATHTVDLSPLPPADRFDYWSELVAKEIAPNQIASTHAHDFDARMRLTGLGPLTLTSLSFPSLTTRRTTRLIRRSDPEQYHLALLTSGVGTVQQDRREAAIQPGHFTLLTSSRPYEASHGIPAVRPEPVSSVVAVIPHSHLPIPHHKVSALFGASLPSDSGMGALLARHLQHIAAHPDQFDTSEAGFLGNTTLDLIAAMLAQQLNAVGSLPSDVRHGLLRSRIDAFIDDNIGDPTLGPQTIAAAHNISTSTLHRLFRTEMTPVAELIRTRRLQRCRRDLANPALRGKPAHAIGARWGYPDRSHFNRAFIAKYGMSPTEYRQQ
ncbi:helix-turn-helix domain-containing protein [Dactylosporangium siamense]|uniref:Transcriptional regulator n=1 Tax=Dactylosporangium siamense TaxID=685454 RepID=A0A919UD80_9ACTN|nr:helix-turn-helix domain-containing protein [Dactylosporangium siamense]GIG51234.1 transcriptional regulator [Dactylosporangium siamense]